MASQASYTQSATAAQDGGTSKSNGRALARFKWMAAVNRAPDLSPVQRAVLISIGLQYSLDDGCCNSGYDKIAAGTPYKRRAVITAVGEMAVVGWIEIEQSRGRHPQQHQAGDTVQQCTSWCTVGRTRQQCTPGTPTVHG